MHQRAADLRRPSATPFHQDPDQAFRLLRKVPWFSAASVGVSVSVSTTAIFSRVDAALLRPSANGSGGTIRIGCVDRRIGHGHPLRAWAAGGRCRDPRRAEGAAGAPAT
jgi:hypothetical protein